MNEPITWGSYLLYGLIAELGGAALFVVFAWLMVWSDGRYCPSCARPMQWRWRLPHIYAKRKYCPFHDDHPL